MDQFLASWMDKTIQRAQKQNESGIIPPKAPGDKLKLLFAGYNGTRNTGSDVRVEEMLRQVRHIFGADRLDLTVFSFIKSYSKGYFGDARQVTPSPLFPRFLNQEVPRHDGVIACEGSTFKSAFTDLLTIMMVGAMGLATAHRRLSVAYGAEAGKMNPWPKRLATEYCKESLVITRNEESRRVLADLDIPSEFGTDTAWTFSPLGRDYAQNELRKVGWNGERLLIVCPINPFWWPVTASLSKTALRLFGFYRKSHYGRIFFFQDSEEVNRKYEQYLSAVAGAVRRFREKTGVFVAVAASEELDNAAVKNLSKKLGGIPTFSSTHHNMYQLVSIFRAADMLLSSRYHAIVTSMATGVPSAGITFDERIANLMKERGHEHLLMRVDDPDLEERAEAALFELNKNPELISEGATQTVARNLQVMSTMGHKLLDYVIQRHPQFEPKQQFRSWEDYLPPMGPELHSLLEQHA